MPNPYDSVFDDDEQQENRPEQEPSEPLFDPTLPEGDLTEPLDELLASCAAIREQVTQLAQLLTDTRAVDHSVALGADQPWLQYFIRVEDHQDKGSLAEERTYHEMLEAHFRKIVVPTRELASAHRDTLRQYHLDIDKNYYSVHKEMPQVRREIKFVQDQLLLQRQTLHNAARDLTLLEKALRTAEVRMRKYINAGGVNHLSASEWALIRQERENLTNGTEHTFNYSFFELNILDRAALSLGILQKKTTAQYLQNLSLALEKD